jgi:hypothetical protein
MVDDAGGGLLLFGRQPSGFPAQLFRLDPTMTWGPVTSSPLPISFFDFALVRDQRSDDIFVVDARNIGTTTPTTFSGRLNLSTTPPSILFTPQPNAFAPFSPPLFNPGNGTRGVMFAGQIVVVGNIVGTSSGRFLFRSAEGGVRTIGSGCPCNGGPGTLQAFASSGSVYPGSTITLAVSNFPGNALMALAASFSQANSTLAAPFFTPPCNQLGLFNPATVTGFTNGSGSIQFSLSIPNSVTMIGTGIFHQALSAQLGGSAPPSCTSNLTEIRVGLVPLPD